MSAFKGTPGPWMVIVRRGGELNIGASHNCTVAAICASPIGDREANARLIAAAPELLGLHEADLTDLDLLAMAIHAGDPMPELVIRVTDMLNRKLAAIARATGADQ